jgi:ABC-2 type transport system permease protein
MYAIRDLIAASQNMRSWAYLALKRVQLENRGTLLGSFWVVLAFGATSTGIAVLIAQLPGQPLSRHVPHVMFGFAGWIFISNSILGGCNVLVQAKPDLL